MKKKSEGSKKRGRSKIFVVNSQKAKKAPKFECSFWNLVLVFPLGHLVQLISYLYMMFPQRSRSEPGRMKACQRKAILVAPCLFGYRIEVLVIVIRGEEREKKVEKDLSILAI